MKKRMVLKIDLQNDRDVKRKAMKTVATHPGIDEVSIDAKAKTLTIIGIVDPMDVVCKLRKKEWATSIISVGPVQKPVEQPKKTVEQSKEANKEEEANKGAKGQEAKKGSTPANGKGKDEEAKNQDELGQGKKEETGLIIAPPTPYNQYYASLSRSFSVSNSMEENPNICTIC